MSKQPLLILLLGTLLFAFPAQAIDERAAAEQFRFAKGLFDRGMMKEAREETTKFVEYFRGSPFDDKGLFLLAEIHFRLEEYKDAAKRFADFVARYPSSELAADAWYSLAWASWRLKDLDQAYVAFEKVESSPDREISADARYRMALIEEARGHLNKAEPILEKLLKMNPPVAISAEAAFTLSRVELALKKPEEARRTLGSLVRRFPGTPGIADAHYNLGELAWMDGQAKTALRHYNDGKESLPAGSDSRRFDRAIAWCLLELEEPARAETIFLQLARKDDQRDDTMLGLGRCRFQLQKFESAVKNLTDVKGKRSDEARFYAAFSLYKLKKFKRSRELFSQLAESKSTFAREARFHEGVVRFAAKDYSGAQKAFETYLEGGTGDKTALARFNIAQCSFNREDYADAVKRLEELLTELPNGDLKEQVRFELAEALLAGKNVERAAAVLKNTPDNSSRGAEAWLRLGDIALKEGNRETALEYYRKSAEAPGETGAAAALRAGRLALEAGDRPMADTLLTRASSGNRTVAREAAWLRGKIACEEKRLDDARQLLQPLADQGQEFRPEARLLLAGIALDAGDSSKAREVLNALKNDKGSDTVRFESHLMLARLEEETGNRDEALRQLEAAQNLGRGREEQAHALNLTAGLLERMGQKEKAERVWLKLDILTPGTAAHLPAMLKLADLYLQSNRKKEALKLLRGLKDRLRSEDKPLLEQKLKELE